MPKTVIVTVCSLQEWVAPREMISSVGLRSGGRATLFAVIVVWSAIAGCSMLVWTRCVFVVGDGRCSDTWGAVGAAVAGGATDDAEAGGAPTTRTPSHL